MLQSKGWAMKTGSPRTRRKAKVGTVTVRNSNNRLQLVFTHLGKRHFVSLGLAHNPLNMRKAQEIAFEVQRDIEYGEFDATYQKYQSLSNPTPDAAPSGRRSKLITLWEKYVEYLRPNASPKTIKGTYAPVTAHLQKCKTDGLLDPLKFRQELLKVTTQSQARRTLMQLSAACKWGLKHRMVASNPF